MVGEKIQQAISILKEKEIDMWLTFVRETGIMVDPMLSYICDIGVSWQSAFIITAAGDVIAIVGEYDVANLKAGGNYPEIHGYVESAREPLREVVRRIDPQKIALNYNTSIATADGLSAGMYMNLLNFFDDLPYKDRFIGAEPIISALRGRKTAEEGRRMREATRITLELFDMATRFIRPGRSEKAIAAHLLAEVERRGLTLSWDAEHCPAVYSGPGTAGAHASPTDRLVQPGHLVNIDFGVRYQGYCADLQRTWYVLKPGETRAPENVQRAFDVLQASVDKVANALKPGVLGKDMDAIARSHLVENGYEEFPHGLGHQVGRETHDGGALLGPAWEKYGEMPFLAIEAGQVFTIEPRMPVPGHGIMTLEEEVWVHEDGGEYISDPQRALWLIPAG